MRNSCLSQIFDQSELTLIHAHDAVFFLSIETFKRRGRRLLGEDDMRRDAPQNASPGRRNSLLAPIVCQDEEFFTLCKNVPNLLAGCGSLEWKDDFRRFSPQEVARSQCAPPHDSPWTILAAIVFRGVRATVRAARRRRRSPATAGSRNWRPVLAARQRHWTT